MKRLLLFVYLLFILLVALYTFRRPGYNWDMLPYMAIVLQYDHHDAHFAHDTVYRLIKEQLPASAYGLLIDGGLPYRRTMAENAAEFSRQMPFYSVKPLYTGGVYLLYKLGVPLIRATVFPATLSYFLIGLLLIFWIKKYIHFPLAVLVSSLIMISAPMWEVARCSSPDGLSALLLLTALYSLLERGSVAWSFIFLLCAVWARLDNLLPACFVVSLMAWKYKVPLKNYVGMLFGIGLSCFLITLGTHQYGWNVLYYPTFLKSLNLEYAAHTEFHLRDYIALAVSHLMTGLFFSYLFLFLALACLGFVEKIRLRWRSLTFDQLLLLAIVSTIVLRFVLQPIIADRLYIAYYLCILMVLIRKYASPGGALSGVAPSSAAPSGGAPSGGAPSSGPPSGGGA